MKRHIIILVITFAFLAAYAFVLTVSVYRDKQRCQIALEELHQMLERGDEWCRSESPGSERP